MFRSENSAQIKQKSSAGLNPANPSLRPDFKLLTTIRTTLTEEQEKSAISTGNALGPKTLPLGQIS
jgi:hypothetical protein